MADQPHVANTTRRPRRRRWLVLAILGLLFAVPVGWWWWQCPRVMRLVARYPYVESGYYQEDGSYLVDSGWEPWHYRTPGLFVQVERHFNNAGCSTTLTLVGWDGKRRWSVTIPGRKLAKEFFTTYTGDFNGIALLALSPDGHLLACVWPQQHSVRMVTWRDGHSLGEVHFSWPDAAQQNRYTLQATNNGHVWLTAQSPSYCRLWAVDGTQVAQGSYTPAPLPGKRFYAAVTSLAPDGATLLNIDNGTATLDYATVQVHGTQVVVTSRYRVVTNDRDFSWCGSGWAVGRHDTLIGPTGLVHSIDEWGTYPNVNTGGALTQLGNTDCRVFLPPPAQPWVIHPRVSHPEPDGEDWSDASVCTRDGDLLLRLEVGDRYLSHLEYRLAQLPIIGRTIKRTESRFAIYTRPGRLCAILPVRNPEQWGGPDNWAISPDSRCVAMVVDKPNGKHELQVYAW